MKKLDRLLEILLAENNDRMPLGLSKADKDSMFRIRYPFEQMTYGNEQVVLIGLNQLHPEGANENRSRTIAFTEEMSKVMAAL